MRGRGGPGRHPERPCAHAILPGAQYALRTLTIRHTSAFAGDITVTQRATWDAVVGKPTVDAACVQATLPVSEGGCGVASASDVAPVEVLAGVMQFLARAEPLLGCDRQLVVPLATEAGLLDALNARLPPALKPVASWTRTGKVELPDREVRRQHWWSARLTEVRAVALLEALLPARQCSHVPQGQGGAEEPGERRLVLADGLGLVPDGVRHMVIPAWDREGCREGDLRQLYRLPPSRPQRTTGPLGGPSAGGPDDGGDGDPDMVGSRPAGRPHLHGGGQPAVVSRGRGEPRPWLTAEVPLPSEPLFHADLPNTSVVPNTLLTVFRVT